MNIFHKYIGSLFWAIKNKKRLGGEYIRFTDEGWCVGLPEIILREEQDEKRK